MMNLWRKIMPEKTITNNLVNNKNANDSNTAVVKADPNDNSSTISNLPDGGNLAQNDVLPIVRAGANFKATYTPPANTGIQSINADTTPAQKLVAGTNVTITDDGNGQHTINATNGASGIQQITSPSGSVNVGGNLSNTTVDTNIDNQTITQNGDKQLQVNTANVVDDNTINLTQSKTAQVNLPNIVDNKTIVVQNNKLVATAAAPSYTSNTLTVDNAQNTINLAINNTLTFYYTGNTPIITNGYWMNGNAPSNVVLGAQMQSSTFYIMLISKPGANAKSGGTYGVYLNPQYQNEIGQFQFAPHDNSPASQDFTNDQVSFTYTETGQECPNYNASNVITYTVLSVTLGVTPASKSPEELKQ